MTYPTPTNFSVQPQHERHSPTEEVRVPLDFPTLQAAVKFANYELQKQSGKTIRILLEPNHKCETEEPIIVDYMGENSQLIVDVNDPSPRPQAELIMDTVVPNQPLLQLVRGHLTVRNLRFEHCSPVDLNILTRTKSCNAAIVMDPADQKSSLHLEHLTITSFSGRGIINRCSNPQLIHMDDVFVAKMWR